MTETITLANPIIRGLACAALHEGLRAILFIDATPAQLSWCAALLAEMLAVVNDKPSVAPMTLTSTATEDLLWGVPFLPDHQGQSRFLQRGLLTSGAPTGLPGLLISADLSQLSLAAQRAAVMSLAAPVVHLERHGQQRHWQPQHCWLAACAQQEVGKLSPHLLDRFLLRLAVVSQQSLMEPDRVERLRTQIADDTKAYEKAASSTTKLPVDLVATLQAARDRNPFFPPTVTQRVLTYVERMGLYFSPRRDIALARLAVAHAMVAKRDQVEEADVIAAAEVMGYQQKPAPVEPLRPDHEPEDAATHQPPLTDQPRLDPVSPPVVAALPKPGGETTTPVYDSDTEQILPAAPLPASTTDPYGEDHLPPEREATSLRLPLRHTGRPATRRGPIVGVGRAVDLHDLALVSTLLEAAKFQAIRQQAAHRKRTHLLLQPSDLRAYRRLPVPETQLVLVIDYTAVRHCDWETALLPHLEWAYVSRATIALIRVGAADAIHELKAEAIMGRSLLNPRIGMALQAAPGRATPLAHGLDLALQTLRHALQHGRATTQRARLVVLTDGRGNIPIAASYAGAITGPVNREGIDDALRLATELSRLARVTIVCLDPQPPQHSELPQLLAESFGVAAEPIPREAAELQSTDHKWTAEVRHDN